MSTETDLVLSTIDARALTDQIKIGVEACWQLITRAYSERAWAALGYTSWDDYCTREFGTSRLRLPREERQEVVSSLRESGLSLRAIESATGISRPTIIKDLSGGNQVVNSLPPAAGEPALAATAQCIHCGTTFPLSQLYEGGQGYECDPCVSPDIPEQQMPPDPYENVAPLPEPARLTTGIDGKSYKRKPAPAEQAVPRRKPLIDKARDIGLDLEKLTKRIEDFGADDRLVRNKEEVAPRLRHHLDYAIKVCQDLNQQLTQGV